MCFQKQNKKTMWNRSEKALKNLLSKINEFGIRKMSNAVYFVAEFELSVKRIKDETMNIYK